MHLAIIGRVDPTGDKCTTAAAVSAQPVAKSISGGGAYRPVRHGRWRGLKVLIPQYAVQCIGGCSLFADQHAIVIKMGILLLLLL